MLQYLKKFSPLLESLCCAVQDEVYIMGCGAAKGLLRHQMWPPSWISPKLRI